MVHVGDFVFPYGILIFRSIFSAIFFCPVEAPWSSIAENLTFCADKDNVFPCGFSFQFFFFISSGKGNGDSQFIHKRQYALSHFSVFSCLCLCMHPYSTNVLKTPGASPVRGRVFDAQVYSCVAFAGSTFASMLTPNTAENGAARRLKYEPVEFMHQRIN